MHHSRVFAVQVWSKSNPVDRSDMIYTTIYIRQYGANVAIQCAAKAKHVQRTVLYHAVPVAVGTDSSYGVVLCFTTTTSVTEHVREHRVLD